MERNQARCSAKKAPLLFEIKVRVKINSIVIEKHEFLLLKLGA